MKTIKIILLSLIAFTAATGSYAQVDTIRIKTTAICEQCRDRIENDLSFEKGVKSAKLDLETKMVTVTYNAKKTDPQKIREAITKIGYDADTMKADLKSFNKLPDCCKHEGKKH